MCIINFKTMFDSAKVPKRAAQSKVNYFWSILWRAALSLYFLLNYSLYRFSSCNDTYALHLQLRAQQLQPEHSKPIGVINCLFKSSNDIIIIRALIDGRKFYIMFFHITIFTPPHENIDTRVYRCQEGFKFKMHYHSVRQSIVG